MSPNGHYYLSQISSCHPCMPPPKSFININQIQIPNQSNQTHTSPPYVNIPYPSHPSQHHSQHLPSQNYSSLPNLIETDDIDSDPVCYFMYIINYLIFLLFKHLFV